MTLDFVREFVKERTEMKKRESLMEIATLSPVQRPGARADMVRVLTRRSLSVSAYADFNID